MRGKRGTLPVHALRYVNSTKVIYRLALERKSVFREVRINANLDLMSLVSKWRRALEYVLSMKATSKKKANSIS